MPWPSRAPDRAGRRQRRATAHYTEICCTWKGRLHPSEAGGPAMWVSALSTPLCGCCCVSTRLARTKDLPGQCIQFASHTGHMATLAMTAVGPRRQSPTPCRLRQPMYGANAGFVGYSAARTLDSMRIDCPSKAGRRHARAYSVQRSTSVSATPPYAAVACGVCSAVSRGSTVRTAAAQRAELAARGGPAPTKCPS